MAQLESIGVDDEFLTVGEVADLLKLNAQTIRNMIDRGELTAVRVGSRRVRIQRADLEAFLSEGRRLTRRSASRVAFDDAMAETTKALRSKGDEERAVDALRVLSDRALALVRDLEG